MSLRPIQNIWAGPDTPVLPFERPAGEVRAAMDQARAAQPAWRAQPVRHRLQVICAVRERLAQCGLALARTSAEARRRPVAEALVAEVIPLAEACRFLERRAARLLEPRRLGRTGRPVWLAGVSGEIRREPHGLVLIIGPGNYPLFLPGVQAMQALAAGNAVVLKPGRGGRAAAQAWRALFIEAGLDPHLFAVLPESVEAAQAALAERPDKTIFTGGAAVGRELLATLAAHGTPAVMELSGCDAVIVRADADLALAAKAIAFGLTLNDGATCLAPKRAFIHRSVLELFRASLIAALEARTGGRPISRAISPDAASAWQDALARGACPVWGSLEALPAVLADLPRDARLIREDYFLPILTLTAVAGDCEAIALANDGPYGLGASVFSRDESAARAVAGAIRAGLVTINDVIIPSADARLPFGGVGQSGFGSTRGAEGLLEMTVPKAVTVSRARFRPAFEPSRPGEEFVFDAYLRLAHARGWRTRFQAWRDLFRRLSPTRRSPAGKTDLE